MPSGTDGGCWWCRPQALVLTPLHRHLCCGQLKFCLAPVRISAGPTLSQRISAGCTLSQPILIGTRISALSDLFHILLKHMHPHATTTTTFCLSICLGRVLQQVRYRLSLLPSHINSRQRGHIVANPTTHPQVDFPWNGAVAVGFLPRNSTAGDRHCIFADRGEYLKK